MSEDTFGPDGPDDEPGGDQLDRDLTEPLAVLGFEPSPNGSDAVDLAASAPPGADGGDGELAVAAGHPTWSEDPDAELIDVAGFDVVLEGEVGDASSASDIAPANFPLDALGGADPLGGPADPFAASEPEQLYSAWTSDPDLAGLVDGPMIDLSALGPIAPLGADGPSAAVLPAADYDALAAEAWDQTHPGEPLPTAPDGTPLPTSELLARLAADIDDPVLADVVLAAAAQAG